MPYQLGSEIQLVLHAKLKITLVGIANPISAYLYQLSRNPSLESPCGAPSPERMACEGSSILHSPGFENGSKSLDENGASEPMDLSLLQEDKRRTLPVTLRADQQLLIGLHRTQKGLIPD